MIGLDLIQSLSCQYKRELHLKKSLISRTLFGVQSTISYS